MFSKISIRHLDQLSNAFRSSLPLPRSRFGSGSEEAAARNEAASASELAAAAEKQLWTICRFGPSVRPSVRELKRQRGMHKAQANACLSAVCKVKE